MRRWCACDGVAVQAVSDAPLNKALEPMSQSPYAPPGSYVAEEASVPVLPRPRQVTIAVILLWVTFGLGFLQWYLMALRAPDIGFHPRQLTFFLIFAALEAALNVYVYRGRNWARIILLVLVAIAAVWLFIPKMTFPSGSVIEQLLDVLTLSLDLIAVCLLLTHPGSSWFGSQRHA